MKAKIKCGRKERGASLVEYALLVLIVSLVIMSSLKFVGEAISDNINESATTISDTIPDGEEG